jgi:hypothetical protein
MNDSASFYRYASTFWNKQHQPRQQGEAQFRYYVADGYTNRYWTSVQPYRKNRGVWITCFVAWNMRDIMTKVVLDHWYVQTLRWSTEDQLGLPYTLQRLGMVPFALPSAQIPGDRPHSKTYFYRKHKHGKRF